MKRVGELIEKIADPDNLRLAFWKARKGKRFSKEVLLFSSALESNLLNLRMQILTGKITIGRYRYFKIYEPKERKICASAFAEQVLHHALMNVCHQYFECYQVHESYASRKGKGTHAALEQAKVFTRRNRWFLKLDVRKFFESIHHEVLKNQLESRFKDPNLLLIFNKIIDSYEASPLRGLPIGNLTSQYFANHYLAGLDHMIKEKLRFKAYIRYMDDMVLWHDNKRLLSYAAHEIDLFVRHNLCCELKPILLNKTVRGLPFLGYSILPYQVKLTQQSKRRFIKKILHVDKCFHSGEWSEYACQRHVLPLLAFVDYADTQKLKESLFRTAEKANHQRASIV